MLPVEMNVCSTSLDQIDRRLGGIPSRVLYAGLDSQWVIAQLQRAHASAATPEQRRQIEGAIDELLAQQRSA